MKTSSSFTRYPTFSRMALCAAVALSCATPAREVLAGGGGALVDSQSAYQVEVLVDGQAGQTFFHAGQSYVLGQVGRRYTLRVWNRSDRRIEAVVSVDGRDVIDGKAGDYASKRGYLVPAWGFVDIDGWRLSQQQAAAFRFTSVANSYAARVGAPRNVGVIGVAVFPELPRRVIAPPVHRHPHPYPYPYPGRTSDDAREESAGGSASPPSASAPAPAAPAEAEAKGSARDSADGALARRQSERGRPGLGTEFGEAVYSAVQEVPFLRASSRTPTAVLGLRYNDRRGLLALGIDVDGRHPAYSDAWLRESADPFPVSNRRYASPPAGWQR